MGIIKNTVQENFSKDSTLQSASAGIANVFEAQKKAVCRIRIKSGPGKNLGYATGFLIAPSVLATCNHVLPNAFRAQYSQATVEHANGKCTVLTTTQFEPHRLFYTNRKFDFTIVALKSVPDELPLCISRPKSFSIPKVRSDIHIIHYARQNNQTVTMGKNSLVKIEGRFLTYTTDTVRGSSGAPLFNKRWEIIGMHRASDASKHNGRYITTDGRYWDPGMSQSALACESNQGVLIEMIYETYDKIRNTFNDL